MSEDITILNPVLDIKENKCRCYYYKGNIFQPYTIHGSYIGKLKKAIRIFIKKNKEMIIADQNADGYVSYNELLKEQLK